jgi:predicted nucleic acid-binding protein
VIFVLDSGVLSRLCHPARSQYRPVNRWIAEQLEHAAVRIVLPEIADYEVRRKLIHLIRKKQASPKSLQRLDGLAVTLDYLPLRTATLRRAAEIWANARLAGVPTAAEHDLDADVILAAQALEAAGTIVTTNRKHLSRFAPTLAWEDIASTRAHQR